MKLENVDLRHDSAAAKYVKVEIVRVTFAITAGAVASREGANHYQPGDALVTGSSGDCWTVSRQRFEARYESVMPTIHGTDGLYQSKPSAVLAKQIAENFSVPRTTGGDLLQGRGGDWLLQYAPGDWGMMEKSKFHRVYRPF